MTSESGTETAWAKPPLQCDADVNTSTSPPWSPIRARWRTLYLITLFTFSIQRERVLNRIIMLIGHKPTTISSII